MDKQLTPDQGRHSASNMTRDWARINLDVSVAYKEDLNRVFSVINDVCQQFKDDPEWGKDMTSTPKVERCPERGHALQLTSRNQTRLHMTEKALKELLE